MEQTIDSFEWISVGWRIEGEAFPPVLTAPPRKSGHTTFIHQEKSKGGMEWERLSPSLALLISLSLSPPECQLILPSRPRSPSWAQHVNGWRSASAARDSPPLACGENADLHLKPSHSLSIIFLLSKSKPSSFQCHPLPPTAVALAGAVLLTAKKDEEEEKKGDDGKLPLLSGAE